ncbi:hypothetical protein PYW07_012957 [Mythimna separata]|uniref:Integrase catalytic domain-containing protein n=1 Tax=Mythimna separata TaxID=271217 RepID=A0AAD8DL08_MYTSE|nr:hypothetical protein PYW07_012957 [Mythimna separata]
MADIHDMFLRVNVRKEDRDSLRFLWRGSRRTGKPEEYKMSSIIFRAASSPATAIYIMNKNAEEFKKTHPEAVKAINRNHYMDDYLQSFASTAEAKKISKEVRDIHARANFHLKGWASNNLAVLSEVEDTNKEDSLQLMKEEKTLGLRWLVKEDTLAVNVGLRITSKDLQDGRRIEKGWGTLFTCLTTRAVHLELMPSLSTSSMIMALRRMAARRGTPRTIFSDNGTNFVLAKKELEEAAQEKGIKWKFIPPGTPNMGGAWERLVRTVKTALAVVLNERSPPEEVLHMLMTEVEHIVNSRPLTSVSMDPEDEESLTPNHFLLGRSCEAMAPGEFDDSQLNGKANRKTTQRLADHFWRRWIKEYLPLLMPRKLEGEETKDPKEGDIVLIVDGTLPRNSWPRGEVVKTYPGPDGRTRVLDVRTSGGILRRPTRRIIVLVPAASSPPEDEVLRTVGENISDDK